MKINQVIFSTALALSLAGFTSCASTKGPKNYEERLQVASTTESLVSKIEGVKNVDAVYTKDKKLRIFVESTNGELNDELIAKIKKDAAAANNISEDKITVLKFIPTDNAK